MWNKDHNLKPEMLKLLEENREWCRRGLSEQNSSSTGASLQNQQMELHKIKKVFHSTGPSPGSRSHMMTRLSLTLVPGDPVPSSGLHGHQAHAGKTPVDIRFEKIKKSLGNLGESDISIKQEEKVRSSSIVFCAKIQRGERCL